ncbi:MAG: MarR family transcriptional regulator [Alphaproteobacteria bacterium]|nr:MarR family transcriptional regulator [Alphaproteobacteria bacterium]
MPAQLQSLELWRHTFVASVRGDAPDLSARQMALMLSVYLGDGPHTVRGLALALKISKPAVSRALDRLGDLGYIRRERDDLDHRNVLVQKTIEGSQFLVEFSRLIDAAKEHVASIPPKLVDFVVEAQPVAASNANTPAPIPEMWARPAAE